MAVRSRSRLGRDRFLFFVAFVVFFVAFVVFFVAFVVRTAFPLSTSADTSNVQRTRRPARNGGTLMMCFDTAIRRSSIGDGWGNSSASSFSGHITGIAEQAVTRQSESFQKRNGGELNRDLLTAAASGGTYSMAFIV